MYPSDGEAARSTSARAATRRKPMCIAMEPSAGGTLISTCIVADRRGVSSKGTEVWHLLSSELRACIRLQEPTRRAAENSHRNALVGWDVRAVPERLLRRPLDPAADQTFAAGV